MLAVVPPRNVCVCVPVCLCMYHYSFRVIHPKAPKSLDFDPREVQIES